jgi:hypothetical protein
MQLSHSEGGNHTIFSFQVKEVIHMDRKDMIKDLTTDHPEHTASYWAAFDDDTLMQIVELDHQEVQRNVSDQLAMG